MMEWSPEVGLALSMKHCSWIVQEDQHGEDLESEVSIDDLSCFNKSETVIEKIRQSIVQIKMSIRKS